MALSYAARGFEVFPLAPRSKVPLILFSAVPLNVDLDTTLTGKTPRHWLARHRGPGQRVRREDQLDGG